MFFEKRFHWCLNGRFLTDFGLKDRTFGVADFSVEYSEMASLVMTPPLIYKIGMSYVLQKVLTWYKLNIFTHGQAIMTSVCIYFHVVAFPSLIVTVFENLCFDSVYKKLM